VANISHDLRTPIAVIRGHLDVQTNDDRSDDIPVAESFAAIDHEIQTLSNLIEDLFTSSRIEDGVLPISLQPVDVGEIVEEAVASVRPYALKTGKVSVHASVQAGPTMALADATRVAQIVNNLVHNAIRHTAAGGLVLVEVATPANSPWLTMTVRDTGEGMPPDVLARMFDRYYQGDEIGEKGGAGLGMSIVQSLVRMLNGDIEAESTVGEGTAITVRLPRAIPGELTKDWGRPPSPG
jgi:two-component system sensor histidine kinase BaeS